MIVLTRKQRTEAMLKEICKRLNLATTPEEAAQKNQEHYIILDNFNGYKISQVEVKTNAETNAVIYNYNKRIPLEHLNLYLRGYLDALQQINFETV